MTTIATRLRLVYLVTLVDTRHRDGRTARYVQLVRPMWTVTHRLSVRCVSRVTMLVLDRRPALRALRVSTMTTMRRARRALGAMWAITLLRHRCCALQVRLAPTTTTLILPHLATTRMWHVLRVIMCLQGRIGVTCALLDWRISTAGHQHHVLVARRAHTPRVAARRAVNVLRGLSITTPMRRLPASRVAWARSARWD